MTSSSLIGTPELGGYHTARRREGRLKTSRTTQFRQNAQLPDNPTNIEQLPGFQLVRQLYCCPNRPCNPSHPRFMPFGSDRPALGELLELGRVVFGDGVMECCQDVFVWAVSQSLDLADGVENGGGIAAFAVGDDDFGVSSG